MTASPFLAWFRISSFHTDNTFVGQKTPPSLGEFLLSEWIGGSKQSAAHMEDRIRPKVNSGCDHQPIFHVAFACQSRQIVCKKGIGGKCTKGVNAQHNKEYGELVAMHVSFLHRDHIHEQEYG